MWLKVGTSMAIWRRGSCFSQNDKKEEQMSPHLHGLPGHLRRRLAVARLVRHRRVRQTLQLLLHPVNLVHIKGAYIEVHIYKGSYWGAYTLYIIQAHIAQSGSFLFSTSIDNRHLETALGIRCLGGIDLLGLVGGDVEVRHLGYTIWHDIQVNNLQMYCIHIYCGGIRASARINFAGTWHYIIWHFTMWHGMDFYE